MDIRRATARPAWTLHRTQRSGVTHACSSARPTTAAAATISTAPTTSITVTTATLPAAPPTRSAHATESATSWLTAGTSAPCTTTSSPCTASVDPTFHAKAAACDCSHSECALP